MSAQQEECCVAVSSERCEIPANLVREPGDGLRLLRCYRCGERVCRECSSVQRAMSTKGLRRIRLCDNCLIQEPDGEARFLLRQYHGAGYPKVTIERCRAEVAAQSRGRSKMGAGRFEIEIHGQVVGEFEAHEAEEAAEALKDFDEGATLRWFSSEVEEPQRPKKTKKPPRSDDPRSPERRGVRA